MYRGTRGGESVPLPLPQLLHRVLNILVPELCCTARAGPRATNLLPGLNQARGKGIPHQRVKEWVASWETRKERSAPKAA